VNKTNGIAFRRWLMQANPNLVDVLRKTCGDAVLDDPTKLSLLADHADDRCLQSFVEKAKHRNKVALARVIGDRLAFAGGPSRAVRRAHQARARIQAPIVEYPRNDCALRCHPRTANAQLGVASKDFRRQSRRQLHAGETDHQAHQRRRQRHQ